MRKDKLIELKLHMYAEQCRLLPDTVLDAAKAAMRESAQKGAYRQQGFSGVAYGGEKGLRQRKNAIPRRYGLGIGSLRRVGMGIAALLLIVVGAVFMLQNLRPGDTGQPPQLSYSLQSLSAADIDPMLLDGQAGISMLRLSGLGETGHTIKASLLSLPENNTTLAVALKYKISREWGVDEVLIIADIKGNLTDYSHLKGLGGGFSSGDILFKGDTGVYVNGEYYSALAFVYDQTDYYMVIMSPHMHAERMYADMLVEYIEGNN